MAQEKATYSHGHHASVVNSHARRTVADSAAFLIPHLTPKSHILDLGCGPGSISLGLAKLVPEGRVLGVDASSPVIETARAAAAADPEITNTTFETGDANALPYADDSFDVAFCHQLLQHVREPVAVLREMKRVVRPGGLVAARDADYGAFAWWPAHEHPALDRWSDLYGRQARANGGEPRAGRMLHVWAREAGFEVAGITNSVSNWCYSGARGREWGETWAQRALHSNFAKDVQRLGLATEEEVKAISDGWIEWSKDQDVWFSIPNGEMLYRVPA